MTNTQRVTFARLEGDVLHMMEGARNLHLSTVLELLELVLAEVRDKKRAARRRQERSAQGNSRLRRLAE